MRDFIVSGDKIIGGRHDLANFLVDRECEDIKHAVRLRVLCSICRSFLYIAWKDMPYVNSIWSIIRGWADTGVENLLEELLPNSSSCCHESGCAKKAADVIS